MSGWDSYEEDYDSAVDMQCGEDEAHYWHYWISDLDILYWCFGHD